MSLQGATAAGEGRNPLFSVVTPVFNARGTIVQTIASVQAQTEADFELILVDDGSTDDSGDLLRQAAAEDGRLRVLTGPNGGVSEARNRGLAAARGSLLAFLDADDLWAPDKLARHATAHRATPGAEVSYARVAFIAPEADTLADAKVVSSVSPDQLRADRLLAENPACTASNIVVTRRALARIGGFAPALRYSEDHEWLVRARSAGLAFLSLPDRLVGYRLSPQGLSADLDDMLAGWRSFARSRAKGVTLARAEAIYRRNLARRALRGGARGLAPLRLAASGLRSHAGAFLEDPRRGALTLGGALLNPILPASARAAVFA